MLGEIEERGVLDADCRDDQRPVEEIVALFATRFGDQQAAMAGCTLQETK